jgi:hypothetical protein
MHAQGGIIPPRHAGQCHGYLIYQIVPLGLRSRHFLLYLLPLRRRRVRGAIHYEVQPKQNIRHCCLFSYFHIFVFSARRYLVQQLYTQTNPYKRKQAWPEHHWEPHWKPYFWEASKGRAAPLLRAHGTSCAWRWLLEVVVAEMAISR